MVKLVLKIHKISIVLFGVRVCMCMCACASDNCICMCACASGNLDLVRLQQDATACDAVLLHRMGCYFCYYFTVTKIYHFL